MGIEGIRWGKFGKGEYWGRKLEFWAIRGQGKNLVLWKLAAIYQDD